MTTFVDTSALYALLAGDDENHQEAAAWLAGPGSSADRLLVTHNYVVVESAALVVARLGAGAARALLVDLLSALTILYVDERLHSAATSLFLSGTRRGPSLVDWVSFEMMRHRGIDQAFAFDRDFARQGFQAVP